MPVVMVRLIVKTLSHAAAFGMVSMYTPLVVCVASPLGTVYELQTVIVIEADVLQEVTQFAVCIPRLVVCVTALYGSTAIVHCELVASVPALNAQLVVGEQTVGFRMRILSTAPDTFPATVQLVPGSTPKASPNWSIKENVVPVPPFHAKPIASSPLNWIKVETYKLAPMTSTLLFAITYV